MQSLLEVRSCTHTVGIGYICNPWLEVTDNLLWPFSVGTCMNSKPSSKGSVDNWRGPRIKRFPLYMFEKNLQNWLSKHGQLSAYFLKIVQTVLFGQNFLFIGQCALHGDSLSLSNLQNCLMDTLVQKIY